MWILLGHWNILLHTTRCYSHRTEERGTVPSINRYRYWLYMCSLDLLEDHLNKSLRKSKHLPNSYFQHATEQLRAIGDDPADMDDQFLLNDCLPFIVGITFIIDDVLNHSGRQWIRDDLLFMSKGTQSYL